MGETDDRGALLELQNLSKNFGAVAALTNVNLKLKPGSVHGIIGDNGAGKSTLMRILAGVHQPSSGKILNQNGDEIIMNGPRGARDLGIEMLHQDLALVPQMNAIENIYLGREIVSKKRLLGRLGVLSKRDMLRKSEVAFQELRIKNLSTTVPVSRLSGGQRQATAIARSVYFESPVVLFDEPTSALGVEESSRFYGMIPHLVDRGSAVAIISHSLVEVLQHCSELLILRQGNAVYSGTTAGMTVNTAVEYITGARSTAPE